MKENQASFTAMAVAYMRAYHSIHATDKIFDDFLAYDLIPEEKRALIEQLFIECWTWNEQLNDTENATLRFDSTTTSSPQCKLLILLMNRIGQAFSQPCTVCGRCLRKSYQTGSKAVCDSWGRNGYICIQDNLK